MADAFRAARWVIVDPGAWMDTVLPVRSGKTRRELAADNAVGLGKVLGDIGKLKAQRERADFSNGTGS